MPAPDRPPPAARPEHTHQSLCAALAPVAERLLTPALVLDLDAVEHNLRAVLARVGEPRRWRPHVKTHKQAAVVDLLLDAGVRSFKCAVPGELKLVLERVAGRGLADADVLLAYPPSRPLLRQVRALAAAHPHSPVSVLADSPAHAAALQRWMEEEPGGARLPVLLDVDTGMRRTGSLAAVWEEAAPALARLDRLHLAGLHGYEGHLGWHQREAAQVGYEALCRLARSFAAAAPFLLVTSGSHSYGHALGHAGLARGPFTHQVSPGTVVLGDARTQEAAADLGLRQAAFVVSRVVSRPEPDRVTLDAGSKALSPDRSPPGTVLGWRAVEALAVSEEHWSVRLVGAEPPPAGALVWVVPSHVCTTVNLHRQVLYLRDGRLAGEGVVEAAGHSPWVTGPTGPPAQP